MTLAKDLQRMIFLFWHSRPVGKTIREQQGHIAYEEVFAKCQIDEDIIENKASQTQSGKRDSLLSNYQKDICTFNGYILKK